MKKIISVLALAMALVIMCSSCVSRRDGDKDDDVTTEDIDKIIDDINKDINGTGTDVVAEVIYKAFDDHAEVVGCNIPIGEVTIASEFQGKKVTKINDSAFSGVNTIKSVVMPDTVTYVGNNAFLGCVALESVIISANAEFIGDYAFYGCGLLKNIDLGSALTHVGSNAFGSCGKLTAINVADANKSFASEDGVLFSADKSVLVSYPTGKADSEYKIPDTVRTIANFAFSYASALTSVDLGNVTSTGNYTFMDCTKLTDVKMGEGIEFIGAGTFQNCRSLKNIVIPEGVKALGYKDEKGSECGASFEGCTGLVEISLPSTIQNIYLGSFEGCKNLNKAVFNGNKSDWGKVSISKGNEALTTIGIITK